MSGSLKTRGEKAEFAEYKQQLAIVAYKALALTAHPHRVTDKMCKRERGDDFLFLTIAQSLFALGKFIHSYHFILHFFLEFQEGKVFITSEYRMKF